NMHGTNVDGRQIDEPLSTVSAGGSHAHLILGFLQHYFGSGKQDDDVRQPLGALTGKARYGLVEVMVKGVAHYIDDIGIRMLEPEEGAAAHGFEPGALPDAITIDGTTRRLTKTEKYHLVGNSVPPRMIQLLAECNVRHELVLEAAECCSFFAARPAALSSSILANSSTCSIEIDCSGKSANGPAAPCQQSRISLLLKCSLARRTLDISWFGSAPRWRARISTGRRRSQFNAIRSDLVLAMLDAGVTYQCAADGCQECTKLTIDHIRALSRGGTDDLSNLQFMCVSHNSQKRDGP
ncbi:MAG: HNH endonuclease, partial [Mesorhizobium sp.]